MAHSHVIAGEGITQARPKVRTIGLADLQDALARGWDDFRAMPSHAVFLCLIYPVVGFVIFRLVLGANVLPLLFPLAAGFALIGPLAALGLYEMSRRREQGLDVSWKHALDVFRSPSLGAIVALGLILVAIFLTRPSAEWLKRLDKVRLPYGSVNGVGEVLAHPQMQAREMIQEIDSPVGR